MLKFLTTILLTFILATCYCQKEGQISTYLLSQYNHTLYDQTIGNNPWGVGAGLQSIFNNKTKFKPTIELTADIYLEDDKTFTTINGMPLKDVRGMVNLFGGSIFEPTNNLYISIIAGPSFIGGQTFLGVKPSLGVFFSKNKRWTGKISYINIFSREKITKHNFGSLSVALGIKLF